MHRIRPATLTSMVAHQSPASTSQSGPIGPTMPAPLTSTSKGPSRLRSCGDRCAEACGVPDVGDGGCGDAAGGLDERDRLGELVARAGQQADLGAGVGEGLATRSTETSPAAGDEGVTRTGRVAVPQRGSDWPEAGLAHRRRRRHLPCIGRPLAVADPGRSHGLSRQGGWHIAQAAGVRAGFMTG